MRTYTFVLDKRPRFNISQRMRKSNKIISSSSISVFLKDLKDVNNAKKLIHFMWHRENLYTYKGHRPKVIFSTIHSPPKKKLKKYTVYSSVGCVGPEGVFSRGSRADDTRHRRRRDATNCVSSHVTPGEVTPLAAGQRDEPPRSPRPPPRDPQVPRRIRPFPSN